MSYQDSKRTDILHGEFKVTPVTMTSGTRVKLPEDPMLRRKTLGIYNNGVDTSDVLWIGGPTVSADPATSSGIPIRKNDYFSVDVGRAEVYAITNSATLQIKVLEIS